MEARRHGNIIGRRDDVVARVLQGSDGVDDAIALLDRAESVVEVPLVDESERARLQALADGHVERASHHHSVLARRDGEAVGYAGLLLPAREGRAAGDLAVARDRPPCAPVLSVLLGAMEQLARRHEAGRLSAWIRHADPSDVACATDEGFGVDRRLAVLGRRLDDRPAAPDLPDGIRLASCRPGVDDDAVAAVLAAAYEGTPDAGWTAEQVRERRAYEWFDPDDLILAWDEDPDGDPALAGLHWTKRRSTTVGEVYNLAVAPGHQGRGLGAVLLEVGLAHLYDRGCHEVLLWVDLDNERAVRLYAARGFSTRWEDVRLSRTIR